jgi:hypothetical protein
MLSETERDSLSDKTQSCDKGRSRWHLSQSLRSPPSFRREPFECSEIWRVRVLVRFRRFQQVEYVLGEHHADGVDRIMAVEPFADQALRDATRRRFISERDLGLDDGVQSGMHLFIRQADTGAVVIGSR